MSQVFPLTDPSYLATVSALAPDLSQVFPLTDPSYLATVSALAPDFCLLAGCLPFCLCCNPRASFPQQSPAFTVPGASGVSTLSVSSLPHVSGVMGSLGTGGVAPVSTVSALHAGGLHEQRTSSVAELRRRAREHAEAVVANVTEQQRRSSADA